MEKIDKELRVSFSVYTCDTIIQGKARNSIIGMLPFSRYSLKPKVRTEDFGGAGLYACFFRDRLIYVGKYLGTQKNFRLGNIISMRWVKHLGSFTMMARNLSFSKKAVRQINQDLISRVDIIPQPILEAFPAASYEVITRERDCVSTYARFDVATHIWQELGSPSLDWFKEFSFIYTKIDTDLPRLKVRKFISQAEGIAVTKLCPPGNSIRNRSWNTYSMNDVFEVFTDSLSCSYGKVSDRTSSTIVDLPTITISEPEEKGICMKFEERIESAPYFVRKFIEQVIQEFDSVDNASIEYTNVPDMRIRKIIEKGPGFVNAATIRWQPKKNRFLLATRLSLSDCQSFAVDYYEQADSLPLVVLLDETIINQKTDNILKYLKYAHKKHEHMGHK